MSNERGFTLIELLVYSVLSIVVLLTVGGILINSLSAERVVKDSTESATAAQLVTQSVSHGVRNASAVWLSEPTAGGQLLTVRTLGSESANPTRWFCQAWYFDGDEIRFTSSAVAIPEPTAVTALTWTLLASDVSDGPAATGDILTVPTMVPPRRQVDMDFTVDTGGGSPVRIKTSTVSRQPLLPTEVEISAPCF